MCFMINFIGIFHDTCFVCAFMINHYPWFVFISLIIGICLIPYFITQLYLFCNPAPRQTEEEEMRTMALAKLESGNSKYESLKSAILIMESKRGQSCPSIQSTIAKEKITEIAGVQELGDSLTHSEETVKELLKKIGWSKKEDINIRENKKREELLKKIGWSKKGDINIGDINIGENEKRDLIGAKRLFTSNWYGSKNGLLRNVGNGDEGANFPITVGGTKSGGSSSSTG